MSESKENTAAPPQKSSKNPIALILIYSIPVILTYAIFINEAIQTGGIEGTKIVIGLIIAGVLAAVYFTYRAMTAKKSNRARLDTTTTITTVVIAILLSITLYACKDFVPDSLVEPFMKLNAG